MSFKTADRSQLELLGYCLDDFVDQDSLCRFVVTLVQELDLDELYADYSSQGGEAYDPSILLCVWFLSYCEGIASSRRVEQLCRRDLHYVYVSANLRPDHCALSRFRRRHAQRLPGLFTQIVRMARIQGLSGFERISIDGTKLEASASRRSLRDLKAIDRELARQDIKAYLESCDKQDEQERSRLQRLQAREERLSESREALLERRRSLEPKDREKHSVSLTDTQARAMSKVNSKPSAVAYNAQAAVDEDTQLIVSQSLCDHPNDCQQFAAVHADCERTLGACSSRKYDADSGYHSLEQLEYVSENAVDAVIAEPRPESRAPSKRQDRKLQRGDFTYQEQSDSYLCPAGRELPFAWRENKRSRRIKVYRSRDCSLCPLRERCLANPGKAGALRRISRDEQEHLAEEMFVKSSSEQGKARLKLRAQTVEPAFGNIKSNLGFRRLSLRGLEPASGEFALMCIAHNLRKMAKFLTLQPKRLIVSTMLWFELWLALLLASIAQADIAGKQACLAHNAKLG
ncbi:IS1182 family transposase [Pelagicoccus mobilis]|uniref:IS1182 family transposase n=1 Tax=Pelagicoccus mobilis TaxID=415221 RepID=A0A934RZY7_9BACT|nr:IS1182 family transposase [Pelagicoccus mobilis]MBK1880735.1 IS1182 family transposase [Pelagicoccus mobilis]